MKEKGKNMENKIFGILCQKAGKSTISELHELFGENDYRKFEIDPQDNVAIIEFIKRAEFDALDVEPVYRRKIMPLLSKNSPEARACGSVNLVLRMANGKLYGHNTEIYGFSYLLDRAGIDVAGKRCLVLGNAVDSAAVSIVLKQRQASIIGRECADAEIVVATASAEHISLDCFTSVKTVIDVRGDQLNSDLLQEAAARGIPAIDGCAMAAAGVKHSREAVLGVEISDTELSSVIRKIKSRRTSVILIGADRQAKLELGNALAEALGRRHYDLDQIIERLNGKSIKDIVSQNGEAELRRIEHVAALWVGKQAGAVITTGDGIVAREDNLSPIKRNGVVVFVPDNENGLTETYRSWCDIELDANDSLDERVSKITNGI